MPTSVGDALSCAAGNARPPRNSAPWRLVWCCERSYKPEEEDTRVLLAESASALQGEIMCCKKAKTFEGWLSRKNEPYALVTDGREIKPCVEGIVDAPSHRRPLLIAVLQQNPVHAARTTAWAATLPARGIHLAIQVVGSAEALNELLREAFSSQASQAAETALGPLASTTWTAAGLSGTKPPGAAGISLTLPPGAIPWKAGGISSTQPSGFAAGISATTPPGAAQWKASAGDATRTHEVGRMGPGFLFIPVCAEHVVAMTDQSLASFDVEAVTRMLTEAAPEVYED